MLFSAKGLELFVNLSLHRFEHRAGEVVLEDGRVDVAFAADGGGVAEACGDGLNGFNDIFLAWVRVSKGSNSRSIMAARTVPAQVRKSLAVKC